MSAARISRPVKAAFAALALVGLLSVVALAARGGHPNGQGHLHQRQVPTQVSNDLLTILVLAYAFAMLVVLVGFLSLKEEWGPPKRRSWWRQLALVAVAMAVIGLFGYHGIRHNLGRLIRTQQQQAQQAQDPVKRKPLTLPERSAPKRPAQFDWVLAGAIGGGLVLVAAVILARRRSELEGDGEIESLEEELSEVVSDAIDDLRAEADARRAVIAAYARMERVLAQHGHPRRRSEAPFEYLGRILGRLRVRPAAVRDLTELFERAKFSTHPIDEPMKARAIAALVSIREDLDAAATAAAA